MSSKYIIFDRELGTLPQRTVFASSAFLPFDHCTSYRVSHPNDGLKLFGIH